MAISDNHPRYLKPAFVAEPLVDRWYAWPHLVSPATAAMNIAKRHLPIMESYVKAPQAHMMAVKNPRMLGGPFLDYPTDRSQAIRELISWTKHRRAPMLELHDAIRDLEVLLREGATGGALDVLYPQVPNPLRGLVELLYDLNDGPSFRLIEPLLYRSSFYDPSTQSLMLSLRKGEDRPFILSTPRLTEDGDLHLELPFASSALDDLYRMRNDPLPLGELRERLGIDGGQLEVLADMTTAEPPRPYEPYMGDRIRWRYFGHACVLIESCGCSILVDPILAYTHDPRVDKYTYYDLPDVIDYVLITHNHQDHVLLETMLQLRHRVDQVLVPRSGGGQLQDPSLKCMLSSLGFQNVQEVAEFDRIDIKTGSITGLPFIGEHADLDVRSKLTYRIQIDDRSLLFVADACNVEPRLFELVANAFGPVNALFLGMECEGAPLSWLYGPLITRPLDRRKDRSRTLSGSNYEQAIAMIDALAPKEVYVYAMGLEPWFGYILAKRYTHASRPIVDSDRLLAACATKGIASKRLYGEHEMFV